jgi:DNA-binding Xre family transcriptional regulator
LECWDCTQSGEIKWSKDGNSFIGDLIFFTMKNNTTARKHSSPLLKELLSETTPVEKLQTSTKMFLASRLGDLIIAKGWDKREFAEKVNKNPSEITKWLSGTQNFTIDTLTEIAIALDMSITDLFYSLPH